MDMPIPLTRELVLLGGGHAHALVLRKWGMARLAGARLTLVSPDPTAPYTGMLPGHVAGHYSRDALDIDLVRLARHAGARLILARATGIDRSARRVQLTGHPDIAYDTLSIDIGITSDMPALPGFAAHGVPAKPLGPFAEAWEAWLAQARQATRPSGDVAIIGGGVAGAELAMSMAHRLDAEGLKASRVTLIEAASQVARELRRGATRHLLRALEENGVRVVTGAPASAMSDGSVILADGRAVPASFVTGVAGATPQPWLEATGLALENGFIRVGSSLQTETDPDIFASGDCAHFVAAPRAKAGVYAVRAAPILHANLRRALTGGRPRAFRPQGDYLKLISTGRRAAIAEKFGIALRGARLWRLKNRIDQAFMDRFVHLPDMAPTAIPDPAAIGVAEIMGTGRPPCAGCGAKVAPDDLRAGLAGLAPSGREDVVTLPGDDAAMLAIGSARQVLSTDHLRAVTGDPYLMARIAAVHALGDIWAMGAAPQAALAAITLPRLAPRLEADWLREATAGASEVFAGEGAAIAGGHTSTGSELVIGFTVSGLLDAQQPGPVSLAGAQAGDALVLTRPIGTGVLLAGEMAKRAKGHDIAGALLQMSRPQGAAAAILAPHAHAMTDVTGFGLAGHLMGMLKASGVAAALSLEALPLLPGARDLAAAGMRSTLWPGNVAGARDVTRPDTAEGDLLFDPQTAGGLLAAVPGAMAQDLVERIRATGEPAAWIGEIRAGTPHITAN